MKSESYMTRALKAHDPRFAKVLSRLGYGRADLIAEEPQTEDALPAQETTKRKRTKKVED